MRKCGEFDKFVKCDRCDKCVECGFIKGIMFGNYYFKFPIIKSIRVPPDIAKKTNVISPKK